MHDDWRYPDRVYEGIERTGRERRHNGRSRRAMYPRVEVQHVHCGWKWWTSLLDPKKKSESA